MKSNPCRGEWLIDSNELDVWVDACSLANGVLLESRVSVIKDTLIAARVGHGTRQPRATRCYYKGSKQSIEICQHMLYRVPGSNVSAIGWWGWILGARMPVRTSYLLEMCTCVGRRPLFTLRRVFLLLWMLDCSQVSLAGEGWHLRRPGIVPWGIISHVSEGFHLF